MYKRKEYLITATTTGSNVGNYHTVVVYVVWDKEDIAKEKAIKILNRVAEIIQCNSQEVIIINSIEL